MSEGDVYREKVLEGYGYKFLRINRFNSGVNPVEQLNKRLVALVKTEPRVNPLMFKIHETIESLQNGDMKECPKCKELRTVEEFKDKSLPSGFGRFCRHCKGIGSVSKSTKGSTTSSRKICPKCNSKMVLRKSTRGQFYGCSRYPYCKGTRSR
jgi:ssDNA-binding Zn-finger/Zn-ribbon topoisomerase 1